MVNRDIHSHCTPHRHTLGSLSGFPRNMYVCHGVVDKERKEQCGMTCYPVVVLSGEIYEVCGEEKEGKPEKLAGD